MEIINTHRRTIKLNPEQYNEIIPKLNDKDNHFWPSESWPRMHFKEGLKEGAHGGHGPIRYFIESYSPPQSIVFRFTKPKGFNGTHALYLNEQENRRVEIKHEIIMRTSIGASVLWHLGIKQLHNALIEDALDKIENHYTGSNKSSPHSWYVKFLRSKLG